MKLFHGVLGIAFIILATVVSGCSSEQSYNTDQCIYITLACVAASDEDLNDKEKEYLNDFVERSGLSQKQIEEVMSNISDSGINLPLLDENDQVERLENELDGIVKADGVVNDKEKVFFELSAEMFQIEKETASEKLK